MPDHTENLAKYLQISRKISEWSGDYIRSFDVDGWSVDVDGFRDPESSDCAYG